MQATKKNQQGMMLLEALLGILIFSLAVLALVAMASTAVTVQADAQFRSDAMKLAQEAELDLVKIVPGAKPPVCKIVDYGKYKYEQIRKDKEARKKQKIVEIKEIRLSPNIDTNDLNTKTSAARKFLEKGNKVKVTLRFRGREMAHMSSSRHILDDFAVALADISIVEKPPKIEGRSMSMFLGEKR